MLTISGALRRRVRRTLRLRNISVPFHMITRVQSLTNVAPIVLAESNGSIFSRTVVRGISLARRGSLHRGAALLVRGNGRLVQIVWLETDIATSGISRRLCHRGPRRRTLLPKVYVLSRGLSLVILPTEHLLLLRYSFVTNGAHLHHSLRTYGTSSLRRSQRINKRIVRLLLWIRTAIEKSNTGRRVLERASVANKGSCIHCRCLSFTERVVTITVGYSLPSICLPLYQKVILTRRTSLKSKHGRVFYARIARPGIGTFARVNKKFVEKK